MRILQIAHSFIPHTYAGTEVYTYSLSKEFSRRNQVFVFFRVNNPKEKEYTLTHGNIDGIETCAINHTFNKSRSFEDTYSDIIIDGIFDKLLDDIKPDVVHIQHLLFLSLGIIKKAKERGIPVIFTLHDYWLICQKVQFVKDNLALCSAYNEHDCKTCLKTYLSIKKNTVYFYNILKKRVPDFVLRILRNAYVSVVNDLSDDDKQRKMLQKRLDYVNDVICDVNLFISPSGFLRNKFIEFGIPESKIIHLSHGIDKNKHKTGPKINSDSLRLGFIGTMLPSKGLDILIEAFKKIRNDNLKLLIFGKIFSYAGHESYANAIKHSVQKDKRIKLMGPFKNDDISRVFSQIDALVVSSIWPENSPVVIQEAFLSDTPVVASRIGGITELVNDGINGLLFNVKDADDLAQKIEYLIKNPDTLIKFKKNMSGVKSIEENAGELESIYRK